jgi:hypothetical protein
MAEVARDRMKMKLCELQADYGQSMDSLRQIFKEENCRVPFLEQLKNLRNLQLKIQELQAEQRRSNDETLNHELSSAISHKLAEPQCNEDDLYENLPKTHLEIDECHQSYTLQQVKRTKELQELNTKLALKEELGSKLMAGMNHMSSIGTDYENSMKDLQQQISDFQKEKDELMHILQKVQNRNSKDRASAQRRKRLQELEQKICELSKKRIEQEKLIKKKEKSDERITQLNGETQGMKQAKVKLIR